MNCKVFIGIFYNQFYELKDWVISLWVLNEYLPRWINGWGLGYISESGYVVLLLTFEVEVCFFVNSWVTIEPDVDTSNDELFRCGVLVIKWLLCEALLFDLIWVSKEVPISINIWR